MLLFYYNLLSNYLEERYFFIFYPALFLIAGKGLSFIHNWIKDYSKIIATILILVILGLGAYQNIIHANQIIEIKKDSFVQLKKAGEFVKANTSPNEHILVLEEPAEILYYSERNYTTIEQPNATAMTPKQLLEAIQEKNVRYIVMSFFYSISREYDYEIINFILSNPEVFRPVQVYPPYINKEQTLPLAIVFEIDKTEVSTLLLKINLFGEAIS